MIPAWNSERLRSPLFGVFAGILDGLSWPAGRWPTHAEYQAWLDRLPEPPKSGGGVPLRVVPPARGRATSQADYEARIYREGALETRPENWHDLFNLLVWAVFPRTKAALNRRHHELRAQRAAAGSVRRGPPEDALTQFDESGVIIACADPQLLSLLSAFRWKALFWERRSRVTTHMACLLFGHGLMEKALAPYRGMTGKGLVVAVDEVFFREPLPVRLARLDEAAAEAVARLARPADLQPVPVLGFPGFSPENQSEHYYDDRRYFRPGRAGAPKPDPVRQSP